VSSPPPPPDPARAVLRSLRDHPHHDTVGEVAAHTGGAASDVARALRELRDAHMVQEADGHWQLTNSGWRAARELERGSKPG
jgi:DNA-binding IclR family transcriptional regulator